MKHLFRYHLWILVIGCSSADSAADIKELVAQQWAKVDFRKTEYFDYSKRIQYLDSIKRSGKVATALISIVQSSEYLKNGDYQKAIEILQGLDKESLSKEAKFRMLKQLGLSYMRMAEQENCLLHHEFESCIVPIQNSGIHHLSEGSAKAISTYHEVLSMVPNDYSSIWLMNLAYMTINKYPSEVPSQYLVPTESFDSDASFPRFRDIAQKAGTAIRGLSGGVCVDDFNNDGYMDIIASSWGKKDQVRYLVNQGDGTFSDRTEASGLMGTFGGLNMVHADYNNDGHLDFLILRGAWFEEQGQIPNSLVRNNGDGTFTDVTVTSGILAMAPTQTASWADVNLDGWVDLFIGNETASSQVFKNELYLNNGDGTFNNVLEGSGLEDSDGYVKGCSFGDIDNDGLPDLYLSYFNAANKLYKNVSTSEHLKFVDISRKSLTSQPIVSFPTWFWDYNNDGHLDIFVSGYGNDSGNESTTQVMANYFGHQVGGSPKLYENRGNGTFREVSRAVGFKDAVFTMGSNFGDLNNDGFLDCYLGTGDPEFSSIYPNRMYVNNGGKGFLDVTTNGGFGHIQKGHGVAFADLDNDGDQDVYMVVGGAHTGDFFNNVQFENPGNKNNWLKLKLEGTKSNRGAIGARVRIQAIDSVGATKQHYHVVSTGGSFGSAGLQIQAGLAEAQKVSELEISWPYKASRSIFHDVDVNQCIHIKENQTNYEVLSN